MDAGREWTGNGSSFGWGGEASKEGPRTGSTWVVDGGGKRTRPFSGLAAPPPPPPTEGRQTDGMYDRNDHELYPELPRYLQGMSAQRPGGRARVPSLPSHTRLSLKTVAGAVASVGFESRAVRARSQPKFTSGIHLSANGDCGAPHECL